MNKDHNFKFFQGLFDRGQWKKHFIKETQKCFERHFSEKNLWGTNPTDLTKVGIIIDGRWSWMNRINTHPNCCLSFYKWCLEEDENFFINLGDTHYHEENVRRMWFFLDKNFEKFFTTIVTDKYYDELKIKCNNSWNRGNIANISVVQTIKNLFKGSKDIEFTFDYGNGEDMNGIDTKFKTEDNQTKTIQVKSGDFMNMKSEFYINGSPNKLKYPVDYYAYSKVDSFKNITSIIIFKNDMTGIKKDYNGEIEVKCDLVIYQKIENMPIPQILNSIFEVSSKNNKMFTLNMEGENDVIINENTVTVIISNLDDPNLEVMLERKLKELQQLLN